LESALYSKVCFTLEYKSCSAKIEGTHTENGQQSQGRRSTWCSRVTVGGPDCLQSRS